MNCDSTSTRVALRAYEIYSCQGWKFSNNLVMLMINSGRQKMDQSENNVNDTSITNTVVVASKHV